MLVSLKVFLLEWIDVSEGFHHWLLLKFVVYENLNGRAVLILSLVHERNEIFILFQLKLFHWLLFIC